MSVIKGLKNINALLDKPKEDAPKVRWLKLADGQSVKIRFIEELDEDSAHYNEKRGLALVVKEHTNPKDYKRKAVDTMDSEGRDWAEEMYRKDPKGNGGWRGRLRFYCNVLVDDGIEAPYVAIWSMGVTKQSSFNIIREYALETGSISNLTWKLKRNGQGTETSYTLIPSAPDKEPFDWAEIEPYALEKALRRVPYAEQESFYLGFDSPSTTSATNIDW